MTESLLVLRSASCPSRILFLDDDPVRAAAFRAECPDAVWVQTAEQCLACLAEPWDEVHLDHDLGGEMLVAHGREDCGMAVIRWLCERPRPHLRPTRFIVHTHNPNAACVMLLHLQVMGFDVQARPFGSNQAGPGRPEDPPGRRPQAGRLMLMRWLRYLRGG